jgi:hypothetical protein
MLAEGTLGVVYDVDDWGRFGASCAGSAAWCDRRLVTIARCWVCPMPFGL